VILLDTNILVYAHRARAKEHSAAKRILVFAIDDPRGCGIAVATVTEFFAVVTDGRNPDRPSTPKEAAAFIASLENGGGVRIWTSGQHFLARLLQLAHELGVHGARIFDLQIALIGTENGATEIWTRDARFVKVPGLRIVDPFDQ